LGLAPQALLVRLRQGLALVMAGNLDLKVRVHDGGSFLEQGG
jgi:hypothetical protein